MARPADRTDAPSASRAPRRRPAPPVFSPRRTLSALGAASALGLLIAFGAAAQTASERAAERQELQDAAPMIEDGAVFGVSTGMTLAEAQAATPTLTWRYEPAFMVDFSASCAYRGAVEAFCAMVYEAASETLSDEIQAIAVLSPAIATEAGARVGMGVAALEALYGEATLSYNWENEGREFLSLAEAPNWLGFQASRPGSPEGWAGVYPEARGAVTQETSDYAADAVVDTIWLY